MPIEVATIGYRDLDPPPGCQDEEEDEEDEEVEEDEEGELKPDAPKRSDHGPTKGDVGWPWKISEQGWQHLEKMLNAAYNTNPDYHDIYIYNDFHGYGIMEILLFAKVFKKKGSDWLELWFHVEAMGYFLASGYDQFTMSDDGDRADRILLMVGAMLIATISHAPHRAASLVPIRNAGVILGCMCDFLAGYYTIANDPGDATKWTPTLVKIFEDAGIEVWNGQGAVDEVKKRCGRALPGKLEGAKKKWGFNALLTQAKRLGPFGGSKYDISKMSAAQRRQYEYDVDSMDV